MDEPHFNKTLGRVVIRFRILGWCFLTVGGAMCIGFFFTAFNPTGKITINGVPTYDLHAKLKAAIFTIIFPLLGAFLALLPREKLESLVRPLLKNAADFYEGIFGPKG